MKGDIALWWQKSFMGQRCRVEYAWGIRLFFSLKLQIVVRQCEIDRVKFWIYGYYVYFCYSVCIQSRLKSNFNESEQQLFYP